MMMKNYQENQMTWKKVLFALHSLAEPCRFHILNWFISNFHSADSKSSKSLTAGKADKKGKNDVDDQQTLYFQYSM